MWATFIERLSCFLSLMVGGRFIAWPYLVLARAKCYWKPELVLPAMLLKLDRFMPLFAMAKLLLFMPFIAYLMRELDPTE